MIRIGYLLTEKGMLALTLFFNKVFPLLTMVVANTG